MAPTRAKRLDTTQRYIALLRAINVGGHHVKMADLCAMFVALDYTNVETFIASGNVIFDTRGQDLEAAHRQRIEQHLATTLGYEVPTFLRTPSEIADISRNAPLKVPEHEPSHAVHVAFLHEPLSVQAMTTINEHETAMDTFALRGRELYWYCRGKTMDSPVKWPKLERAVKAPLTMRNMKTVKRLSEKFPA